MNVLVSSAGECSVCEENSSIQFLEVQGTVTSAFVSVCD